jgi:hypothetical protein
VTARARMDEGHAHRAQGENQAALESFRVADDLMHVPSTTYEVARSLTDLGRWLEAHETALLVRKLPRRDDEPEAFVVARREADRLVDDLESRIPTLEIRLDADPSGVDLRVDGAQILVASSVVVRKLDPGTHVVVARIGDRETHVEVTLAERESRALTLSLPPIERAAMPTPLAPLDATRTDSPTSPSHALAYAGVSIAGLGVVTGVVTGWLAWDHRDAARPSCVDGQCPPSAHADVDAAHSFATVSTIAFAVGGLGLGLIALDFVHPLSSTPTTLAVTPTGVVWSGVF